MEKVLHCGSEEGCTEPTPWKCVKGFNKRNEFEDFPNVKVFERDPLGLIKTECVLTRETVLKTTRR